MDLRLPPEREAVRKPAAEFVDREVAFHAAGGERTAWLPRLRRSEERHQ